MKVIRTPRLSFRWAGELLWSLSAHRVSIRYKETLFGFGWIFLQPVALTLVFNYIHRVAKIQTGNIPYPLFAATGLVAWSLTSLVVSQAAVSVAGHGALLKRIALPKILLPLSVIVSSLADLCVMGLLLVGLFIYYQTTPSWGALWILVPLLTHLAFLVGAACLVSLANVFLRDVAQAIPSLLQMWFFASPVFYPSSMVPREFVALARWNPMTGLIESYRSVLLTGTLPSLELFIPAAIISFSIFLVGLALFHRLEGAIVDLI